MREVIECYRNEFGQDCSRKVLVDDAKPRRRFSTKEQNERLSYYNVKAEQRFYDELTGRTPQHRLRHGAGADRKTPELVALEQRVAKGAKR